MASTKFADTKPTGKGTEVVSWKDKLKGYAKEAVTIAEQAGGSGGNFISFKSGQITFNKSPCTGNKLDTIVIAQTFENAYYEDEWDPGNPKPPVCFAFGPNEDEMAPHEKSTSPQASSCASCEHNKFGSAEKGKGKACKNVMRLALLPAKPLDVEVLSKCDAAYAKLPVTSVKGFATYIQRLSAAHELPPFAFVTQIGTVPDAKSQFKVTFEDIANLSEDDELMDVLIKRHEEQVEMIGFPYQPVIEEEETKEPATKAKGRGKF